MSYPDCERRDVVRALVPGTRVKPMPAASTRLDMVYLR